MAFNSSPFKITFKGTYYFGNFLITMQAFWSLNWPQIIDFLTVVIFSNLASIKGDGWEDGMGYKWQLPSNNLALICDYLIILYTTSLIKLFLKINASFPELLFSVNTYSLNTEYLPGIYYVQKSKNINKSIEDWITCVSECSECHLSHSRQG